MIDIYTHILPEAFARELDRSTSVPGGISGRIRSVPAMHDLAVRFRIMDEVAHAASDEGAGYRQVISLPNPALEDITSPQVGAQLARVANDAMAELCAKNPDRFPAFVAAVSLLDVEAAVVEVDRAVGQLGARGVQIFTNIAGKPLDLPEYQPLFAAMARHGLPIWLHPTRTAAMPDYRTETRSRYEMWWCFGWPYETSVAMTRLVLSGLYDRHPELNIITHHGGGMVPFFDGRVGAGLEQLGSRTPEESYEGVLSGLKRPHLEYFHNFFADTAMFGSDTGLHSSLKFFGAGKMVFATDAPFGPIPDTIEAVNRLDLSAAEKAEVLEGNARRLLRLDH